MPTTSTMRSQYPEAIVRKSPLKCDYSFLVPVKFLASSWWGGAASLKFHPDAAPFMAAVAAVMLKWGYQFRESSGGSAVCRGITGGTNTSLHAHAICFDINPSKNGYSHTVGRLDNPDTEHQEGILQWGRYTDMPPGMIKEIEAIRSKSGKKAIEWGGRWYNIKDAMHFELDLLRADAKTGVNMATVAGIDQYLNWIKEDDMPLGPGLAAAYAQKWLIDLGYDLGTWTPHEPDGDTIFPPGADGDPGDDTELAVRAYQTKMGLTETGNLDALTVGMLNPAGSAGEGPRGPKGEDGERGPEGPPGETGEQGPPGEYRVIVEGRIVP